MERYSSAVPGEGKGGANCFVFLTDECAQGSSFPD